MVSAIYNFISLINCFADIFTNTYWIPKWNRYIILEDLEDCILMSFTFPPELDRHFDLEEFWSKWFFYFIVFNFWSSFIFFLDLKWCIFNRFDNNSLLFEFGLSDFLIILKLLFLWFEVFYFSSDLLNLAFGERFCLNL